MRGALKYNLLQGVGGVADPLNALFAASRKGGWWSWRLLAGAEGGSISAVEDRSPNNNDLEQSTGAAQPVIAIDGGVKNGDFSSSKSMQLAAAAAIDIGSTTTLTIIAAMRLISSAAAGVVCETGLPFSGSGGASMLVNNGDAGLGGGLGTGSGNYSIRNVSGVGSVPRNCVLTMILDTTQTDTALETVLRVDGIAQSTTSVASVGAVTGNIASPLAFRVGRRSNATTTFFNNKIFDLIILPGAVDASLLDQTEAYLFEQCRF